MPPEACGKDWDKMEEEFNRLYPKVKTPENVDCMNNTVY